MYTVISDQLSVQKTAKSLWESESPKSVNSDQLSVNSNSGSQFSEVQEPHPRCFVEGAIIYLTRPENAIFH
jgi:hypothetical protein